jgi:hypothetical protein
MQGTGPVSAASSSKASLLSVRRGYRDRYPSNGSNTSPDPVCAKTKRSEKTLTKFFYLFMIVRAP